MITNQHPILDQIAAKKFKESLICTLSLSSKELFHSNMIGWLLENNPEFAKKFFEYSDFGQSNNVKVEREKFNFDLMVNVEGKLYVIENKVKSIPDINQIFFYQEKARKVVKSKVDFILLSLMEPPEEFKRKAPSVKLISYEQIHGWIIETVPSDGYTGSMLKDYAHLLSTLIRIKFIATNLGGSSPFLFSDDDEKILRSIRLFDVAQKIRYSCLADLCEKRLRTLQLQNLDSFMRPIEVALTRSIGLMSIKIAFGQKYLIGLQLQGIQYRFFIQSTDGSDVQDLAETLQENDLWLKRSDAHKDRILKFGKDFKYVYCLIKGESGEDLVNRVASDISRLFEDQMKISIALKLVEVKS